MTTPRPTIVLVHGAFADSSSWNGVIADLHQRGYATAAVANPLRGLQHDAAYLRSVLDYLPGPVVLVGHSYGGSVMSEAAEGAPNVAALVYVASFNLEVGESTAELAAKFPGGELGPALEPVPFPLAGEEPGTDLYIQQDKFREVFAADVDPEVAALMAATQRPIAGSALEDVATKAAWKTIPSWTLVTTQDLAIPAESMRFMASRAGSTTVEVDASHAVSVSRPDVVAELIDDAARATVGAGTEGVEVAVDDPRRVSTASMQTALDLIGLFAFGVSGALLAIRLDFDVVGIVMLAVLTALGGGILRDLVLGDTPPPAFTEWEYLVVPLAAAAVAFVAHPALERLTRTLLVFDAAGLGLFCVSGTLKALDHGLGPVAAVVLGVTTAVGGGVLRDVVARQTPTLVRPDSELYAVAAIAGASAVAIAWEIDAYEPMVAAIVAAGVFGIRVLALQRHWHGPRAVTRWRLRRA